MLVLVGILALFGGASAQRSYCTEQYGVQTFPHEQYCDKFHLCVNGTYSEQTCANGLAFDGHGHVHNYCNYNWAVDCGDRLYDDTPISSPGCLYQYGIYPIGEGCQTTFFKCAAGTAYETPCKRGLAYDPEKHVCDYPGELYDCKDQAESVVGFKCPSTDELPPNAIARRFLPYPRFPMPGDDTAYIVCVNYKPRIQYCGDGALFDQSTLSCYYVDYPAHDYQG